MFAIKSITGLFVSRQTISRKLCGPQLLLHQVLEALELSIGLLRSRLERGVCELRIGRRRGGGERSRINCERLVGVEVGNSQRRCLDVAHRHRKVVLLHQGNRLALDLAALQAHQIERLPHVVISPVLEENKIEANEEEAHQEKAEHQKPAELLTHTEVAQLKAAVVFAFHGFELLGQVVVGERGFIFGLEVGNDFFVVVLVFGFIH